MEREKEGIVIDTHDGVAKVKLSRHGECSGCGLCPGDNVLVLEAENCLGAKPGQHVHIQVPEVNMLRAAFVIYILPLILTLTGYAAGAVLAVYAGLPQNLTGGIAAFLSFAAAVVYIRVYDKSTKSNRKMQPVITRVFAG